MILSPSHIFGPEQVGAGILRSKIQDWRSKMDFQPGLGSQYDAKVLIQYRRILLEERYLRFITIVFTHQASYRGMLKLFVVGISV